MLWHLCRSGRITEQRRPLHPICGGGLVLFWCCYARLCDRLNARTVLSCLIRSRPEPLPWVGGRVGWTIAVCRWVHRGKSGLHRARWWVTPTRGDPRDSATENKPPVLACASVRVKRRCKRPPAHRVTGAARQTPPGARSRGPARACANERPAQCSRVDRMRPSATAVLDG